MKKCFFLLLLSAVAVSLKAYWQPYWWALKLTWEPAPTVQSLPNPLPGQRFSDTWGAARSQGRKHEGVDIFAKRGTPIRSTTKGLVVRIGQNRLGGNVVSIIGPGRVRHYYAHLDGYADIRIFDWVEAGTVIGYVGDSGNAKGTPPHLHYGIYTVGGAVNPYPLIKQD
ncbi:peptidase M23 [Chelonobacter oris]|uniref:Peptidase M23 n=1 Tax=Chelonobacter oris TaxID=505317 RepID=A0A0A3BCR9_9PAST|nr:peptidase M23 [Chelonobacter oris]MDH3000258.1 peptidase M23 [Chelonobacter oris]